MQAYATICKLYTSICRYLQATRWWHGARWCRSMLSRSRKSPNQLIWFVQTICRFIQAHPRICRYMQLYASGHTQAYAGISIVLYCIVLYCIVFTCTYLAYTCMSLAYTCISRWDAYVHIPADSCTFMELYKIYAKCMQLCARRIVLYCIVSYIFYFHLPAYTCIYFTSTYSHNLHVACIYLHIQGICSYDRLCIVLYCIVLYFFYLHIPAYISCIYSYNLHVACIYLHIQGICSYARLRV